MNIPKLPHPLTLFPSHHPTILLSHHLTILPSFPLTILFLFFAQGIVGQTELGRRIKLPEELKEVSGVVVAPSGMLWMLNDSRNPSVLFCYDIEKKLVVDTVHLPVPNRDWEDLAADAAGYLYIGDFGNNSNRRTDLRIYRFHPDSRKLDSILFHYPDQIFFPPANRMYWNFDCEAMVFYRDSLHLFSKNIFGGNDFVKHYVIPASPGRYTAELRDSVALGNRVATGASISPDGKNLALTAYIIGKKWGLIPYTKADIYIFEQYPEGKFLRGRHRRQKLPKCMIARQFESVAWFRPDTWIVANEGRSVQRQSVWRIRVKR